MMRGWLLDRHRYTAKPCPRCATPCITHDWCARCGRSFPGSVNPLPVLDICGDAMPETPEYDRAVAILEDHRRGLHDEFDSENGCRYPGCDEAWWQMTTEVAPE